MAVVVVVVVAGAGVVSDKSLWVAPRPRGPLATALQAPGMVRPRHRDAPPLSVRRGTHDGGRVPVHGCGLCPFAHDIAPCLCQCLNDTAAVLLCGPEVSSCSQLTEVMSLSTYPVNAYLRLVVADTSLGCKLEKELWGPLVFQEILITNNRFQALDNRAFQPFSATLTHLNLEGNSLQDVYFGTMSDTPLLKLLTLRNNAVTFLPGYSTMELPLLETFDASYNYIKAILPETFAGMAKLRHIDLRHNAITKVSAKAFAIPHHDGSSLAIQLANNHISHIEPGILEGVRVCSVDLQDNYLTVLPENVFRPIIDFTAASSVFLTNNNPFDCDTKFCWIATNQTVSETFNTVLCPNLDNHPVEVIIPMCILSNITTTPHSSRRRHSAYRKSEVPPVA